MGRVFAGFAANAGDCDRWGSRLWPAVGLVSGRRVAETAGSLFGPLRQSNPGEPNQLLGVVRVFGYDANGLRHFLDDGVKRAYVRVEPSVVKSNIAQPEGPPGLAAPSALGATESLVRTKPLRRRFFEALTALVACIRLREML